jgi:hypothetical protein
MKIKELKELYKQIQEVKNAYLRAQTEFVSSVKWSLSGFVEEIYSDMSEHYFKNDDDLMIETNVFFNRSAGKDKEGKVPWIRVDYYGRTFECEGYNIEDELVDELERALNY